jgi:hypothetical protein
MWNIRSAADLVVPTFICLISALIANSGAQAQTATDANDSKRVQVLQIREASAAKQSSVTKSKSAATPTKKKVVQRNTIRQTGAAANEGVPSEFSNKNMPVQSTLAQNNTPALSTEQTGILAVGNRAVAIASSPGEDNNVSLSAANFLGSKDDPTANGLAIGNPPARDPHAIADAKQASIGQIAAGSGSFSPMSQVLATLSGAMLAAAFGWYLISSSRRGAFG